MWIATWMLILPLCWIKSIVIFVFIGVAIIISISACRIVIVRVLVSASILVWIYCTVRTAVTATISVVRDRRCLSILWSILVLTVLIIIIIA